MLLSDAIQLSQWGEILWKRLQLFDVSQLKISFSFTWIDLIMCHSSWRYEEGPNVDYDFVTSSFGFWILGIVVSGFRILWTTAAPERRHPMPTVKLMPYRVTLFRIILIPVVQWSGEKLQHGLPAEVVGGGQSVAYWEDSSWTSSRLSSNCLLLFLGSKVSSFYSRNVHNWVTHLPQLIDYQSDLAEFEVGLILVNSKLEVKNVSNNWPTNKKIFRNDFSRPSDHPCLSFDEQVLEFRVGITAEIYKTEVKLNLEKFICSYKCGNRYFHLHERKERQSVCGSRRIQDTRRRLIVLTCRHTITSNDDNQCQIYRL